MNCKLVIVLLAMGTLAASPLVRAASPPQKDYLSSVEADKIRDAETVNDRIKLFLTFADDRLKKFQYELDHPSTNRHGDMLNSLLNAYVGCVDDAADLIQLGLEKQDNIRQGVDLMSSRTKDFLAILEKLSTDGPDRELYKENLDDAIDGTRDAMNDAEKAKKKVAPHRSAQALIREDSSQTDAFRPRQTSLVPGGSAYSSECSPGSVARAVLRVSASSFIRIPAWS